MFRGGRVDSRGTGITTGLDRPGMQGGGLPPTGNPRFINLGGGSTVTSTPTSTPVTGGGLLNQARTRLGTGMSYLSNPKFSEAGILNALKTYGPKAIDKVRGFGKAAITRFPALSFALGAEYLTRPQDVDKIIYEQEGYGPIEGRIRQILDPTYGRKMLDVYSQGYDEEGNLIAGKKDELPEVLDDLTNKDNNQRDGDGGAGDKETSTDIKDAIREDKELFAELLGAKKARGQDISDMLLSFSSKALAPDADVKSAFAEFAADEVKRPSRVRKVDDNAAALAINAYIAGEKSKADLDRALKVTEGKLKMETDILKNRSLISRITNDRSPGKTFSKMVSDNTKSWMEDNGLAGTPNKVKTSDIEESTGPGKGLLVPENENAVFIDDTNKVYVIIKDGAGNLTLRNLY
jgi:hypothetical protein